jgi:hypothetical protein
MKKLLTFLVWLSGLLSLTPTTALSLSIDDIADENASIYRDTTIYAAHQYFLTSAFDLPSKYLCLVNQTGYQKYANLEASETLPASAYRVNINEGDCFKEVVKQSYIVKAVQPTIDDPLTVTLRGTEKNRMVFEVVIEEAASSSNPFGIMTLNVEAVTKEAPHEMVFKNYSTASLNQDSSIAFKSAMFLDQVILEPELSLDTVQQFYGVDLTHYSDSSGQGTIVNKYFNINLLIPEYPDRVYPDGTALFVSTTNVAYSSDHVIYETFRKFPWIESPGPKTQACIERQAKWTYVDSWGVYNSSGARNTETFDATYTDSDGTDHILAVDGKNFSTIAPSCRAWADGSEIPFNGTDCIGGISNGISENSNFPIKPVEPPNFSMITRDFDGAEFLVKHLVIRQVYPEVDIGFCSALQIPETRTVPYHPFFSEDTFLDHQAPAAGAIIANAYRGDAAGDPKYEGKEYVPTGDEDQDGVLNYADAFPEDSTKTSDIDNDGIDETEDVSDDRTSYDYSEFYAPAADEVLSP